MPQPGPAVPGPLAAWLPAPAGLLLLQKGFPLPELSMGSTTSPAACGGSSCQPCPARVSLAGLPSACGFLQTLSFPAPLTAASRRARSPRRGGTSAPRGMAGRLGGSQPFSKSRAAPLAARCASSGTFAPGTSGALRCADLPRSARPAALGDKLRAGCRAACPSEQPVVPPGVVPSLGTWVVSVGLILPVNAVSSTLACPSQRVRSLSWLRLCSIMNPGSEGNAL